MIKGVIFDLSGTIIDNYSLSSLINLRKVLLSKHNDLYPSDLIKSYLLDFYIFELKYFNII